MSNRNGKLLIHKFNQYLLPSIVLVFALQIGCLANGIIMGQFVGATALSAASLATPFVYLLQLPALSLPAGLAIVLGNLFSKRKFLEAKRAFNVTLLFGLILSTLFIFVGIFFTNPICEFLCGSFTEYIPLMEDYLSIYFYSSPIYFIGLLVSYVLASDNHPHLSSLYFIIVSIVHIVCEILFCLFLPSEHILVFVAMSNSIGFIVGLVVLIPYFLSKKRLLHFSFTKVSFVDLLVVLKASLTNIFTYLLMFIMSLLIMRTVSNVFNDTKEMNVYVIITNMLFVIDICITGIIQMLPSIVSVLYGEKDYSGIRYVIKRVSILLLVVSSLLLLVTLIYPNIYLLIFGIKNSEVSSDYELVIRIYAISFLFYSFNKLVQCYYPSILKNLPSLLNTFLQHGILGIPIGVGFIYLLNVKGYAIGMVLIEFLSLIITLVVALFYGKKIKIKNILLVPKSINSSNTIELSINNINDIEEVRNEIRKKATELGGDSYCSTYLALGSEELLKNTFTYGYKNKDKNEGIDIFLRKEENVIILSMRENGVAFDPTIYDQKESDGGLLHSIPLIKKLCNKVNYLRILNMNETIIEMDINRKDK